MTGLYNGYKPCPWSELILPDTSFTVSLLPVLTLLGSWHISLGVCWRDYGMLVSSPCTASTNTTTRKILHDYSQFFKKLNKIFSPIPPLKYLPLIISHILLQSTEVEQAQLISVAASFNTSTRFNLIFFFFFFTLLGHRKTRARNHDHTNIFMPTRMQGLSFCGQIYTHKFVLLFIFQCKQWPCLHTSDAPVPPMLQCLLHRWNLNERHHLISHVADLLWGPACSHLHTYTRTSILVRPRSDVIPPAPMWGSQPYVLGGRLQTASAQSAFSTAAYWHCLNYYSGRQLQNTVHVTIEMESLRDF